MNDELQPTGVKRNSDQQPPLALVGWTHLDMPNGIDLAEWTTTPEEGGEARAIHAGDGPLVLFAGRLVQAPGVAIWDVDAPDAAFAAEVLQIAGLAPPQEKK